jgi:hypothetical protein
MLVLIVGIGRASWRMAVLLSVVALAICDVRWRLSELIRTTRLEFGAYVEFYVICTRDHELDFIFWVTRNVAIAAIAARARANNTWFLRHWRHWRQLEYELPRRITTTFYVSDFLAAKTHHPSQP